MISLPKLEDLDLAGKWVLVRMDLDLSDEALPDRQAGLVEAGVPLRLETSVPTIKFLLDHQAKVIILGHRGRPEGKIVPELSLQSLVPVISKICGRGAGFVENITAVDLYQRVKTLIQKSDLIILENLRFDPGEEANSPEFAANLAGLGDLYVNEAFAVSHREHASIVGLPQICKSKCNSKGGCVAAGFRFEKEIENLSKVFDNPKRPVVVIISGLKEDKLTYLEPFSQFADKILVGGRLPEYLEKMPNDKQSLQLRCKLQMLNEKLLIAQLNPDKEDITINSIERFEKEIERAGTVILAGPIGHYEEGQRLGTERVFRAVAKSGAFKIAGGGDTEAAIKALSVVEGFDWISVGGGAMLEYLAKRTLPGLVALVD